MLSKLNIENQVKKFAWHVILTIFLFPWRTKVIIHPDAHLTPVRFALSFLPVISTRFTFCALPVL